MNTHELEKAFKRTVSGEVRFDDGSRALYATDASNYRQVPIGVVIPKNEEDVISAVDICRRYGAPLLTRGAGTSLAGQCCNVAVVLDFSRLNKILEIDPVKRIAHVQSGVILDDLRNPLKPHGLTFGPDPATHNRCTFGGMIGNNACGVHSVMAGKTVDNIESLEILTYDGHRLKVGKTSDAEFEKILHQGGRPAEIYAGLKRLANQTSGLIRSRFPNIPRRVSGYNLDQLLPEKEFNIARSLVGTEGTCAIILSATVKLISDPPSRVLLVLGYPDIFKAGDDVKNILEYKPIGLEGLDQNYVGNMRRSGLHLGEIEMLPSGNGWLLVEFGAFDPNQAEQSARKLMDDFRRCSDPPLMQLFTNPLDQKKIWSLRESSFGATVFVPGVKDTYAGFEDAAVPPDKIGDYMRDLAKLCERYDYYAITYGHFGDGCLHIRISFDLRTDEGIKKYRNFLEDASDLVIRYGGSLSGEHGDGQTWGEFLHKMYGTELVDAFRQFKALWDPENKMNPGKVVNAYRADENLRLKNYSTIAAAPTHFQFPEEKGDFARTTERCIGIGKCLKKDEGIMCPSYMAIGEEMHSTRGRAHLLHEMMRGEVIHGGWQDEHVKESLDLCLACKGCKSECPVKVDVATYKAEFLSHYYEKNPRPVSAYLFGLISEWAKLGSKIPRLANFVTQNPVTGGLLKKFAGIAPERTLPAFAAQTFKQWFRSRTPSPSPPAGARGNSRFPQTFPLSPLGRGQGEGKLVLLWPDTFNNYFYPEIAIAAVEVLEKLGFHVLIPDQGFCCGRPLYDYGMLSTAKQWLKKILKGLSSYLDRGIPIIGLEPSCVAIFRDELLNLFPNDEQAKKLAAQSFLLAEFLQNYNSPSPQPSPPYGGEGDANTTAFPLSPVGRGQGEGQKVLLHPHCHQKSIFGMESEIKILERLGLDFELLDSGCCGMAGAFGFEKDHYDISMKIGERVLLPALRQADPETMILTDGFSCREQIRQSTGRRALHLAELIRKTMIK